ncbi:MAG TPA: Holliday junction resolvase RuvX [Thermomicrobiales bacterium]|jgi:putative Holliday junction resolvase|nr:Holliday junction resolvase RuvX [Thermomicrobiales bacterium]
MSRRNDRGRQRGRREHPADALPAFIPSTLPDRLPTLADRHVEGTILGIDVGGRRIGVAVSDETRLIATPVDFIERGPNDRDQFRRVIARFGVGRLVAGLPTGMSGREGPQAADVRGYADALAEDLDLPLDYWDERLSTAIAERTLIAGGTRRADRKTRIDAVAAAVILQGYLDHERYRNR